MNAASPRADPATPEAALAALCDAGAQRHDPVRFSRLEVLARRAEQAQGALAAVLGERFTAALADYRARHAQALAAADTALVGLRARHPQAAQRLAALRSQGDLRALDRLAARLAAAAERSAALAPLRELRRVLAAHDAAAPAAGAAPELKALRASRATWARLSVDRQLNRSLQKTPDNPGPLNSHALVLRALQQMDAIAPCYLDRFVSQVETLLWLDRVTHGLSSTPAPARGAAREDAKPAAPARRRTSAKTGTRKR